MGSQEGCYRLPPNADEQYSNANDAIKLSLQEMTEVLALTDFAQRNGRGCNLRRLTYLELIQRALE